ncbi:MAG: DUF5615 family PIN-like protein [Phycisphaeraceae bacterium]
MRLLLDSCMSPAAAAELRAAGHDVDWAGDWANDPGDQVILALAHAEQRILITLDKDFGELAVFEGRPHHGILRIVDYSVRRHGDVCLAVLAAHGDELLAGAIATAEPGRLRIRPSEP